MHKTLIKHGNNLALVIEKPILNMQQISLETPLELTTNGDALIIRPVRDMAHQAKIETSLNKLNGKYAEDFKRLAE